ETGVMQDLHKIRQITEAKETLLLSDATQCVGRYPIRTTDADMIAFSAHKFYGPKGIGGLYVNPRLRLQPLIYGGGHERGLRSGTLNTTGIVGMGAAAQLRNDEGVGDHMKL